MAASNGKSVVAALLRPGLLVLLPVVTLLTLGHEGQRAVEASGDSVVAVSSGFDHTCALTTGSRVKCWGHNNLGQVGDGTIIGDRTTPVDVCASGATAPCTPANGNLLTGVTAISAGFHHSCALTAIGSVKCWGTNQFGQLGDGNGGSGSTSTTTPVDVCAVGAAAPCTAANGNLLTGITAIFTGGIGSCALTSVGTVKCWGHNRYGSLGNGDPSGPEVCGFDPFAISCSTTPVEVCATGATAPCSSGGSNILAGVTAISAGSSTNCALLTGGSVKCWGFGQTGERGDGTTTTGVATPVDVCATGATAPCTPGSGNVLADIAAVSVGSSPCALTGGGGIKCWGRNFAGQLGDGTTSNSTTPVDVCSTGGTAPCTPGNGNVLTGVTGISAGGSDSCGVTDVQGVKCWGLNTFGALGEGTSTGPELCATSPCSTTPVEVCAGGATPPCTSGSANVLDGVTAVSVGGPGGGTAHVCVRTEQFEAKCWGYNGHGPLGIGTSGTSPNPLPVDVLGVKPPSVGGVAELPEGAGAPLETGGSSRPGAAVAAAFAGAVVVALCSAGWYARRRRG